MYITIHNENIRPGKTGSHVYDCVHALFCSCSALPPLPIEINPGWENGLMIPDSTYFSNSERSEKFALSVNAYIPVRVTVFKPKNNTT